MSGPFITAAVQFVAGAYSAKSAIEGLNEGNIAKAVMGGVGAYAAFSGLGTTTANAAQGAGAQEALQAGMGSEAASSAANESMVQNLLGSAGEVGSGFEMAGDTLGTTASGGLGVTTGMESASEGLGNMAASGGFETATIGKESTGILGNAGPFAAKESGLLSQVGDIWGGMDPITKYGAMQLGGGMLKGHAQEELLEKKWDREERLDDEERRRKGYTPNTQQLLSNYKYIPGTGWRAVNKS